MYVYTVIWLWDLGWELITPHRSLRLERGTWDVHEVWMEGAFGDDNEACLLSICNCAAQLPKLDFALLNVTVTL